MCECCHEIWDEKDRILNKEYNDHLDAIKVELDTREHVPRHKSKLAKRLRIRASSKLVKRRRLRKMRKTVADRDKIAKRGW